MIDQRHVELLRDCETYLERQRNLLNHLAAVDEADAILPAMDSALDQLAQAVRLRRRELAPYLATEPDLD